VAKKQRGQLQGLLSTSDVSQAAKDYWNSLSDLEKAALVTSPVPGVGTATGVAADTQNLIQDPSAMNTGLLATNFVPFNKLFGAAGGILGMAADAGKKRRRSKGQTVDNPQRTAFPGVYKDPRELALEAEARVAPEDPMLKQLFGVTRDDLAEMNRGRVGNREPTVKAPARARGSAATAGVTNRKNAQRLVDQLTEAESLAPELTRGMTGWYEMQPVYDRMAQLSDNPAQSFKDFQTFTGMSSPGSDVLTEINRGTAARYLNNQGRFDDFVRYAGMPSSARGADFPEDIRGVMGHPYHSTAQAKPMQNYVNTGEVNMKSAKVPLYIESAGVPQTGFQTDLPVGDAHFARGVGLADTRTNKDFAKSVEARELLPMGDWYKNQVAAPVGLNPVNAQAIQWGLLGPQTGVDTALGAPKLELLTKKIMDASKAYGVSPEQARDLILQGEMYAPNLGLLGIK